MTIFVVILMAVAYIAMVALLLAYVVVFIAPRFTSGQTDPADNLGRRADEYLLEEELRNKLPRRNAIDPVCGQCASLTGLHTWPFRGRVYYFCSESCQKRFARNPGAYVLPSGKPRPVFDHFCKPR